MLMEMFQSEKPKTMTLSKLLHRDAKDKTRSLYVIK